MRVAWVIEGMGAGQADVASAEEAVQAVLSELRSAYGHLSAGTLAGLLTAVVAPFRATAVTDGRYAVERGRTWHYTAGSLYVTLSP